MNLRRLAVAVGATALAVTSIQVSATAEQPVVDSKADFLSEALTLAVANGDPRPTAITEVTATIADAEVLLGDDETFPDYPQDAVVRITNVTGNFTLNTVSAPYGLEVPTVQNLISVDDPDSGDRIAWAGGEAATELNRLDRSETACRLTYGNGTATAECTGPSGGRTLQTVAPNLSVTPLQDEDRCVSGHCHNVVSTDLVNKGVAANLNVRCQRVPNWHVDLIDHELWVVGAAGNWIEVGVTKGANLSEDHVGEDHRRSRFFWARKGENKDPQYIERYGDISPYNANIPASILHNNDSTWGINIGGTQGTNLLIGSSNVLAPTATRIDAGLEEWGNGNLDSGSIGSTQWRDEDRQFHDGLPGAEHEVNDIAHYFKFMGTGWWRFTLGSTDFNACAN